MFLVSIRWRERCSFLFPIGGIPFKSGKDRTSCRLFEVWLFQGIDRALTVNGRKGFPTVGIPESKERERDSKEIFTWRETTPTTHSTFSLGRLTFKSEGSIESTYTLYTYNYLKTNKKWTIRQKTMSPSKVTFWVLLTPFFTKRRGWSSFTMSFLFLFLYPRFILFL